MCNQLARMKSALTGGNNLEISRPFDHNLCPIDKRHLRKAGLQM